MHWVVVIVYLIIERNLYVSDHKTGALQGWRKYFIIGHAKHPEHSLIIYMVTDNFTKDIPFYLL